MRDFITAASLGVVAKLYDDLTDNSIIGEGITKESLFTLLCFLIGAVSYNDFTFSSIFYSAGFIAFLGGPESYEHNKEKSLLYAFPLILLLSLFSFSSISSVELFLLICTMVGTFLEAVIIKEDVSVRKLIMRSLLISLLTAIIIGGLTILPISGSFMKLLFCVVAYLSVSVVYQIYSLFFKNTDLNQKWSALVNSVEDTKPPKKTETPLENTEQEKVSDSLQEQV